MFTAAQLIFTAISWRQQGLKVAVAVVAQTWGSAPMPEGSLLIIAEDGRFEGSVSAGCVEGAVIQAALDALARPQAPAPLRLSFGVSDDQAWSVGLACGGTIVVWIDAREQLATWLKLCAALEQRQPVAWLMPQDEPPSLLTAKDDATTTASPWRDQARAALAARLELRQSAKELEPSASSSAPGAAKALVCVYRPPTRLVLIGAVHIAQALTTLAAPFDLELIIIDPRRSFAQPARHSGQARLIAAWPAQALEGLGLDEQDALVVLSHDPKLDDEALIFALRHNLRYVGALGSRRTHAARCERLLAQGVSQAELERVRGPVGLPIGARGAAEIALSILADVIKTQRTDAR